MQPCQRTGLHLMNTMILDNLMAQMDPKGLPAFSPAAKAQVRYLSALRAVDPKGLGTFSPAAKAQVRYLSALRAVDPKGLGTFSPAAKMCVPQRFRFCASRVDPKGLPAFSP